MTCDPCTRHVRLFLLNAHIYIIQIIKFKESFANILFWYVCKDGKFVVLPSGELHIKDVRPEDGFKEYRYKNLFSKNTGVIKWLFLTLKKYLFYS